MDTRNAWDSMSILAPSSRTHWSPPPTTPSPGSPSWSSTASDTSWCAPRCPKDGWMPSRLASSTRNCLDAPASPAATQTSHGFSIAPTTPTAEISSGSPRIAHSAKKTAGQAMPAWPAKPGSTTTMPSHHTESSWKPSATPSVPAARCPSSSQLADGATTTASARHGTWAVRNPLPHGTAQPQRRLPHGFHRANDAPPEIRDQPVHRPYLPLRPGGLVRPRQSGEPCRPTPGLNTLLRRNDANPRLRAGSCTRYTTGEILA